MRRVGVVVLRVCARIIGGGGIPLLPIVIPGTITALLVLSQSRAVIFFNAYPQGDKH